MITILNDNDYQSHICRSLLNFARFFKISTQKSYYIGSF